MDDLTAFVAARLDEDEAAARESYYEGQRWLTEEEGVYRWPDDELVHSADRKSDARHIARHDPARALREVEAGRRILARHSPAGGMAGPCCTWCSDDTDSVSLNVPWPCPDVLDLLSRWAGHPDFRPEWKP